MRIYLCVYPRTDACLFRILLSLWCACACIVCVYVCVCLCDYTCVCVCRCVCVHSTRAFGYLATIHNPNPLARHARTAFGGTIRTLHLGTIRTIHHCLLVLKKTQGNPRCVRVWKLTDEVQEEKGLWLRKSTSGMMTRTFSSPNVTWFTYIYMCAHISVNIYICVHIDQSTYTCWSSPLRYDDKQFLVP